MKEVAVVRDVNNRWHDAGAGYWLLLLGGGLFTFYGNMFLLVSFFWSGSSSCLRFPRISSSLEIVGSSQSAFRLAHSIHSGLLSGFSGSFLILSMYLRMLQAVPYLNCNDKGHTW